MANHQALQRAFQAARDDDLAALYRAGAAATGAGLYELVRDRIAPLTQRRAMDDARLWQVLGLAQRGLQNGAEAHAAFARAVALAPDDPLIAHSHARTALEAGHAAVGLYDRARALRPTDGAVILGRAAAQFAAGAAGTALADLATLLVANPGWVAGHETYARLAAASGLVQDAFATLDAAIARHPRSPELHRARIRLHIEADDHASARLAAESARAALGRSAELDEVLAIAQSETGECGVAQAVFDRLGPPCSAAMAVWRVRTLIRLGRLDDAASLAERCRPGDEDLLLWPYRALLWRLADDPRWAWLEGDPRLIGVYDISAAVGPFDRLAECLRTLHTGKSQPFDQSLRGGSQTDGVLLARAEPEIRRLRAAIVAAVEAHVAQLPPPEAGHPTLLAQRAPVRLAGSWSVRLAGAGFHIDHIHSHGWLSSAFYVALPGGMDDAGRDPQAGWLTFGENRALVPDLAPIRLVEPRPGRLVLFPSTMWHGTRPFAAGERLTVAFDVARPDGIA